jgi:tRNA-specific 2-thiouridylase
VSKNGKKVVVAMSGGVDSSVAAALLLREGYDVVGVFMRLGSPAGVADPDAEACEVQPAGAAPAAKHKQGCCSVLDADDARRVAGMLDVPFYVLNFQDDFGRVIDYFVDEYNRGRTPNPCVRCNDWLKFGKLAKYAEAVGADYVASGHYARTGTDPATGRRALLRGLDHRKDQSYVLFGITPAALEHTLLPIGGLAKHEVRAIAGEMGLPVFNKPDSQEICFVPNNDYAGLVERRTPGGFRPGAFVDAAGKVVGTHGGHQHFTVGQRKGLGVALGYPIYVADIDAGANRVTLAGRDALLKSSLVARQLNLLDGRLRAGGGGEPFPCAAKIRYNHDPQPATARVTGPDELTVRFDEPQSAITPGQAVVLYDGDRVLGGGWIDAAT